MSKFVSGYMMTYNELSCIEAAVRNMVLQVDDFLIMDGASTDGTLDIISDLMDEFPHIRLVVWPQNCPRLGHNETGRGWYEPDRRNYCLRACKHDWVFTMDADELVDCPANYFREVDVPTMMPRYNLSGENEYVKTWNKQPWYPDCQMRFFNRVGIQYTNTPLHCVPARNNGKGKAVYLDAHTSVFHLWHYHPLARMQRGWHKFEPFMRKNAVFALLSKDPPPERWLYRNKGWGGFK